MAAARAFHPVGHQNIGRVAPVLLSKRLCLDHPRPAAFSAFAAEVDAKVGKGAKKVERCWTAGTHAGNVMGTGGLVQIEGGGRMLRAGLEHRL